MVYSEQSMKNARKRREKKKHDIIVLSRCLFIINWRRDTKFILPIKCSVAKKRRGWCKSSDRFVTAFTDVCAVTKQEDQIGLVSNNLEGRVVGSAGRRVRL